VPAAGQVRGRRLDAPQVMIQGSAADFDLDVRESEIGEPPDLAGQRGKVGVRVRVSAAGVDGHGPGRRFSPEPAGQEPVQRQVGDLGGGIPEGHVEGADRHAPFTVATGFLAGHHDGPGPEGVEVGAVVGGDVRCGGPQQAGREAFPDQPALGIAPDRGEAVADHRPSGPGHVGDDGHQAGGETAGRDARVAVARDPDRSFPDVDDAHSAPLESRCL
jgi:hypothetical protein